MHQTNQRGHNETSTRRLRITGVQGMPQMARSIGTPGCHRNAKHIGVQHINEYATGNPPYSIPPYS
jgi:hypothetical protein